MTFRQRVAVGFLRTKFRLLSAVSPGVAAQSAIDLFRTPQLRTLKQPDAIFQRAESLSFGLGDVEIRGYRWNKGAGKRVLLVHGFQSSVVNFGRYIELLIEKRLEVLAFDAPAHGRSSGQMITAPLFAQMISSINVLYGPICRYMAHSFGAMALALYVESTPHDATWKLVFIAPLTETTTAVRHFFQLLGINRKTQAGFNKGLEQLGGHPVEWYSLRRAAKNIRASMLWVHDKNDDQTPVEDALLVQRDEHPNIRFVITENLGHRRIYRDEHIQRLVVEFLGEIQKAPGDV
ncbi:MAG TPA: alpha/beta fold hydrolase [Chitinophagaceae bacterium]